MAKKAFVVVGRVGSEKEVPVTIIFGENAGHAAGRVGLVVQHELDQGNGECLVQSSDGKYGLTVCEVPVSATSKDVSKRLQELFSIKE